MTKKEDQAEVGSRLKGARTNAGLSLQQVADALQKEGFDVSSRGTVGHWETGRNIPDIFILRRLAKMYDVPLDALAWESALSMEAMGFAVQYERLDEKQKRTLRAIWVAYITEGNTADGIAAAPASAPEEESKE